MIPIHTNWFLSPHQSEGLDLFVKWALENVQNPHFVTVTELLLWMTNPDLPLNPETLPLPEKKLCSNPQTCQLEHTEANGINTVRYMRTCSECPLKYPWLGQY